MLYYNLRFTVNRINSSNRIIAYIQLFIEDKYEGLGWENSLRIYRTFVKDKDGKSLNDLIKEKIDKSAVPDKMGFYPFIWEVHFYPIAFSFIISYIYFERESLLTLIALLISGLGLVATLYLFYRNGFTRMREGIERERAIFKLAFEID